MEVTKEQMKTEAIKRLKMLKVFDLAIDEFVENDTVMVSEPPYGGLYTLDDEQKKMVKEFEDKFGYLVYLVVRSYVKIKGESETQVWDSMLYVYNDDEEWDEDRQDIKDGYPIARVVNHSWDCADVGAIKVKSVGGGVVREFN